MTKRKKLNLIFLSNFINSGLIVATDYFVIIKKI